MPEIKDKCVPKLRFPEFKNDGEWEEDYVENLFTFLPNNTLSRAELNFESGSVLNVHYGDVLIKFGECLDVKRDVMPRITDDNFALKYNSSRLKDGDIIIADTAEDETVGKCTEIVNLTDEIVVPGLHTIALRPKREFASRYLGFYMNSYAFRTQLFRLMQGVKVTSISKSALKTATIRFPSSIDEQRWIASCLSALDEMLSASNDKLEQLKVYKKGLMQKLFPTPGKTLPEYRFPEFKDDKEWTVSTLGAVTKVINRRNKSNRVLPVYSISNKRGFILQSEQFDGVDSNDRGYDISAYKIVTSHLFAYNPARINVGSWGYSDCIKEGLISSLYVCFKCTDELADDFLKCFMDSYYFQRAVDNNVEGGIRSYLFYENFSRIKIPLPSLQEQKKVASCIISVNSMIDLYSERVETLESYKKSLMQRLFP